MRLLLGNCLEQMKTLPENSVDSIVTDPPYGLSFMGKHWDYDVPTEEIWREALRVLKPGGHLLAFFGTRTYHRGVVRIEDAGFEIRDQIMWIYGSGFPKSHNIGKAIDKLQGVERKVVGQKDVGPDFTGNNFHRDNGDRKIAQITKGNSEWEGWGTALKPANEPIVVARKPLEKGLTVAENVLKWGTGALNIDGSRIGHDQIEKGRAGRGIAESTSYHNGLKPTEQKEFIQGRWPANILFDEDAANMLDEQSGLLRSGGNTSFRGDNALFPIDNNSRTHYKENGGASRFFYVAKASKSERNAGLDVSNHHPTVKPIKLMQYLIKLVTPPNGTVLDPFMGSGSTGVAAKNLGFDFIGCEMNEEYFEIAKKRIGV